MDGFVVTRADAHQSEVCAPHDDCLAFLTGFTGSAGLALVLADRAILFVDGRYALQVHLEVDAALFEIRHLYDEPLDRWLKDHAMAGWRIGFDPMRVTVDLHDRLQSAMELSGASLVASDRDPFDAIWKDRPAKPLGLIREMPLAVSGEDSASKRARVAKSIAAKGADILVETLPDNIAWLLNVRGSDVPMNPVPHSFAIVDKTGALEWFVDARKLGNDFDLATFPGVSISHPDRFLNRGRRSLRIRRHTVGSAVFACGRSFCCCRWRRANRGIDEPDHLAESIEEPCRTPRLSRLPCRGRCGLGEFSGVGEPGRQGAHCSGQPPDRIGGGSKAARIPPGSAPAFWSRVFVLSPRPAAMRPCVIIPQAR